MSDVNLTTLTNLDLAGYTLTGNVTITSEANGTLDIKSGTIAGDLTVNAKNATVNNTTKVNGTITIEDVSSNTWNEKVSGNKLIFEAENKTLHIPTGVIVEKLTINKAATVITSSPVHAIVAKDVTVTVKVSADATEEIVIEGTGEEVKLDPEKEQKSTDATLSDLTVDGTTVEGFTPEMLEYNVELEAGTTEVPVVVAVVTATGKANVNITTAQDLPGTTIILVTAEDGITTKTYKINFKVASNKEGKATANVKTTSGDNYDVNPLGTVSVTLTYGDNIKTKDIQSLEISIYKDDKELAKNTLQPEKLNDKEKELDCITSPFNLGRREVHDKWAWKRGEYALKGDVVTKEDLPNKIIATYVVNKVTYVSKINVEELTVPEPYRGLEAPEDGKKELKVDGLTEENVRFLVKGLGDPQTPSTLDEVRDFMVERYSVKFNIDAIEIENGKISIKDTILNTKDWNKIKKDGENTKPYKITVLIEDKDHKVAKIAMYQDGKAVIEEIK